MCSELFGHSDHVLYLAPDGLHWQHTQPTVRSQDEVVLVYVLESLLHPACYLLHAFHPGPGHSQHTQDHLAQGQMMETYSQRGRYFTHTHTKDRVTEARQKISPIYT